MEDPRKLRELAVWYREFAERTGNPAIWHARLTTADELEREADRLEKRAAQGRMRPGNGAAGRAVAILAIAAGLLVAAVGAPEAGEPAQPRPSAKEFALPNQPDLGPGEAHTVDELYRQLIGSPPASSGFSSSTPFSTGPGDDAAGSVRRWAFPR